MRYHNITKDDMLNGDGLRVVLWLAGCSHKCKGCHNTITWDPEGGIEFDSAAKTELFELLSKSYISGITFSGGDPLNSANLDGVESLINEIKHQFPDKTIWLYSGYTWEEIFKGDDDNRIDIISSVDVFVDGRFEESKMELNYKWAGSTNQRVIDVQKTLKEGNIVIH